MNVESGDQSLLRSCSTRPGQAAWWRPGSWRSSSPIHKIDDRHHLLCWLSKPTLDVRTSKTTGCPSTSSGPESPRCYTSSTALQAEPTRLARHPTQRRARAEDSRSSECSTEQSVTHTSSVRTWQVTQAPQVMLINAPPCAVSLAPATRPQLSRPHTPPAPTPKVYAEMSLSQACTCSCNRLCCPR